MNGLFLYYYINFFFNIHGYTFSFYDYALSPALEVLYFVCSYPEIIPTVWVVLGALYTRKYFWGFVACIVFFCSVQIIKSILKCYIVHALFFLILLQVTLMTIIWLQLQIRKYRIEFIEESRANNTPRTNFRFFVGFVRTLFCHGLRDIRPHLASEIWGSVFEEEMNNLLSFTRTDSQKNFRAGLEQIGMECCICMCEFEYDEALTRSFRCSHLFHQRCCKEWLRRNVAGTCPLCRSERQ
jgi:Ring finger domain